LRTQFTVLHTRAIESTEPSAPPLSRIPGSGLGGELYANADRLRLVQARPLSRRTAYDVDSFARVVQLRDALARTLKLDPAAISVKHVQGPGCYGHNGADYAAADAAIIAFRQPGKPDRVGWRREEKFRLQPR
jgi:hypothetical protein